MSFFWKRTYTQANFCFLKSVAQIFSHSFIEVGGGAAAVVKGDSDWLTCLRARHMSWVNAALPTSYCEVSGDWVYSGNVCVWHRATRRPENRNIANRSTDALLCLSVLHGLLNGIYELTDHKIHISEMEVSIVHSKLTLHFFRCIFRPWMN